MTKTSEQVVDQFENDCHNEVERVRQESRASESASRRARHSNWARADSGHHYDWTDFHVPVEGVS